MSFPKLYTYVQTLNGRISRTTLRTKIVELTAEDPKVFIRTMDTGLVRGLFVMAAEGTRWNRQAKGRSCILVGREQDDTWRRFVEIKELMHVFDRELEYVGTDHDFATLLEYLTAPNSKFGGQNHLSDNLAIIMALACVCPEAKRQEYVRRIDSGDIAPEAIARELDIPLFYVHWLVHENFKGLVKSVLELAAEL